MTCPKKSAFVLAGVFLISWPALAQTGKSPAEKTGNPVSVREATVTEWKLPNGLEVVHIHKPSSRVLASVVTVNVGSKDETADTNGLSHLLEHMVFDGTTRRTRAEINEGSKRYGGYVNATTQAGFTSYISIFPAEFAELSLDLQADMLFHSTIPAAELEKERLVVIEEMKKDRDSALTRAAEMHDELLYAGTPYARPVLGFENILHSVSQQKVLGYYKKHYVPARMKVMISSPFLAAQVRSWMNKTFGLAAAAPHSPAETLRWNFPVDTKPQYKEDAVPSAFLHISSPAPALGEADFFAFDLLTRYLAEGGSSPVQRALRSARLPLADAVGAELETEPSFSVWKLSIVTQPEQIPEVIETLKRTLQSSAAINLAPEEVSRLQRQVLSQEAILSEQAMYYGLLKAPLINAKGYRFMAAYPERLRGVTAAEVRRVAERYFSNPRFFITALVPKGKGPPPEAASDASAWIKEVLPNGMTLVARGSDESEVFALSLFTRQRSAMEPASQEGISDFVQRLLLKGTPSRSEEAIQKELDSLSAQTQFVDNPFISFDDHWTSNRLTFFRLEVLDEWRGPALDLISDVVSRSNFPEAPFLRVRDEILRLQQREADNSSKRASQRLHELLLASTFYARSILGSETAIRPMTQKQLAEHFKHLYAPSNLVVVASGKGTSRGVLRDLKNRFENLKGEQIEITPSAPSPRNNFLLEKISAHKQQTQIAAGTLVAGWGAADAAALRVLNSILSERLAVELREKQGLAYAVGSELQQEREYGWMEIRLGTRAETSEQARQGVLAVIQKLAGGDISEDEQERAVNGLWGSTVRARLSRIGQTFYRGWDEVRGSGYDAEEKLLPWLRAVPRDDLRRLAREIFNTDRWVMVSVGKN